MATQTSPTGVYTNTSPLATDLNPETPSPDSQYSRNWSILIQDPQPGSEWLMKRGSSGDWVKFVQGGDKVWCGWDHIGNCNDPDGSQDEGGSERKDYKDQSFTMGKLFDQNGNDLNKPYFNGCGLAGGCRNSDADGIGFSATWHHNNGGFAAGSAWPPVFRWNGEEDTIDSNKTPYTIWYRPINDSSLWLD